MLRFHQLLLAMLFCLGGVAFAEAPPMTALGAIKLLPRGVSAKIALLEAREGNPAPDRWHILVHDPKEENGLHEYVVAGGEIVASRALSQFAESLSADDVFGDVVKIDSDKVAKLAQQYAEANGLALAEMNFELKKDGAAAAPLWNVTCLDADGNEIGRLVLTATKGTVLSHEGFSSEPVIAEKIEKPSKDKDPSVPTIAKADPERKSAEPDKKPPEPRKIEVKKAEPIADGASEPPEERKPGFLHRAGGALQRLFTGHDSASRPPAPAPAPVSNAPPPPGQPPQ